MAESGNASCITRVQTPGAVGKAAVVTVPQCQGRGKGRGRWLLGWSAAGALGQGETLMKTLSLLTHTHPQTEECMYLYSLKAQEDATFLSVAS